MLELDANIRTQVNKLRRDLLKLIGIGNFADEAIYQDPCLSFIVPEVTEEIQYLSEVFDVVFGLEVLKQGLKHKFICIIVF